MKIKIKRFDKTLPLPEYKTQGAVAFDLSARIDVTIAAGEIGYVPLNVAIETPNGHLLMLCARSSLHKRGLMPANGFGVIDRDYSGDEDELTGALYNFTNESIVVARGDRIMQGVIVPYMKGEWEEREAMGKSRGGFGTTGVK